MNTVPLLKSFNLCLIFEIVKRENIDKPIVMTMNGSPRVIPPITSFDVLKLRFKMLKNMTKSSGKEVKIGAMTDPRNFDLIPLDKNTLSLLSAKSHDETPRPTKADKKIK